MATVFPIIKTDRLLLRQFSDADLENVFKGLSHPAVIKHYGISFRSIEATKEQMNWFSNLEKTGTGIWWAICSVNDAIFYGAVGLNSLLKEHRKSEIGFWLLPGFWKKGIMTEAIPLICNYAFTELGLHRIEGLVETENAGCKRLMAKLNFRYEGTMRECEIKNGTFISLDIYAKLK